MDFVILNSPSEVGWYAVLFDVIVLTFLAVAVVAAVRGWKRGRRDYAILVLTAPLYGMSLEISGMLTHKSYLQGDFLLMFNFTQWSAFSGSTDIPSYVPLFYPAFLFFGYKLAETLGISSNLRRAIAGGAIMGLLDVTYIIEGGLRHVVWWTWRPYEMYELWQGWPAMDLAWEMTWGALLFWMVLEITPRVDRWFLDRPERRVANHLAALVAVPLALVVLVNIGGVILLLPFSTLARLGIRHWPAVAALAAALAAVLITARKNPPRRVDRTVIALTAVYVGGFAPMVLANIFQHDELKAGIAQLDPAPNPAIYIPLQVVALLTIVALAAYPAWARRRNAGDPAEALDVTDNGTTDTPKSRAPLPSGHQR